MVKKGKEILAFLAHKPTSTEDEYIAWECAISPGYGKLLNILVSAKAYDNGKK